MPKRQPKEAPEVTIGNLQREVLNLRERCAVLVQDRDNQTIALRHRDEKILVLEDDCKMWLEGLGRCKAQIAEMTKVIDRMEGWHDCAREMFKISGPQNTAWPWLS